MSQVDAAFAASQLSQPAGALLLLAGPARTFGDQVL